MKELRPCGTKAAYNRHLQSGEKPCAACRAAHAAAQRAYYAANPAKRWHRLQPEKARKQTREWQRKNKLRYQEPKRQEAMRKRHGSDYEVVYAAFWQAQQGLCYLCEDPLVEGYRTIQIDHDHRCSPQDSCPICRRGLACPGCNVAIGHAHDDPDRLRRIADNLEAARALVTERLALMPEQLTFDLQATAKVDASRFAATVNAIPASVEKAS